MFKPSTLLREVALPEVEKSEIVYSGYCNLRLDHLAFPQGSKLCYTVLVTKADAAVVLAETKEGTLIINQEYRYPVSSWLLSLPGGRIDEGESPEKTAQRELLEETGYSSEHIIPLGATYPFPAISNQKIYYFFAKEAIYHHPPRHEPFELIHSALKSKETLLKEISQGIPADGILCTALLLAQASGALR